MLDITTQLACTAAGAKGVHFGEDQLHLILRKDINVLRVSWRKELQLQLSTLWVNVLSRTKNCQETTALHGVFMFAGC